MHAREQTRDQLTNTVRQALVDAVCAQDWPAALSIIEGYAFTCAEDRAARERILDRYVAAHHASAKARWDENVGGLMWALGCQPGEPRPRSCTDALVGIEFQRSHDEVARENALANLASACERPGFAHQAPELTSVGWREALLDALAALVQDERAEPFCALLVHAPALADDLRAQERRWERLDALARRAGGYQPLIARLRRDPKLMLRCYRAYSALARERGRVDVVELLMGLLALERERDFLITQLLACERHCARCGAAYAGEGERPVARRRDGGQSGGVRRPRDYELVCAGCAREARIASLVGQRAT